VSNGQNYDSNSNAKEVMEEESFDGYAGQLYKAQLIVMIIDKKKGERK